MRTSDLSRIRHRILSEPQRPVDETAYTTGVDHALAAVRRFMLEELRAVEQERARQAAGATVEQQPPRRATMI